RLSRPMPSIIPPPLQADVEYSSTASPGRCRVFLPPPLQADAHRNLH
ncbi:hypothetical protein A2U01_0058464, partial [Trifolium medium]|nr:hypothetical protein [Trifolium medium]